YLFMMRYHHATLNKLRNITMLTLPQPVEVPEYNPENYNRIREVLKKRLADNIDAQLRSYYGIAMHLSYCVQNLHKNFWQKLKEMQCYFEKNKKLPSQVYFEPSMPRVFPPPPKTKDDLPNLNKTLVHHADFYSMESLATTWNSLIIQYHAALSYALEKDMLDECICEGTDGCFDKCISDMGEWHAMNESAKTRTRTRTRTLEI
ncbi:MAG: hypothetical protein AB7V32_03230, partial [Candidatus Berkiella sp.]